MSIIANLVVDNKNYLKIINEPHDEIHDGDMFNLSYKSSVTAASTVLIYFKTPNTTTRYHWTCNINSSSASIWAYLCNSAVAATSSYTVIVPKNKNLGSATTCAMTFGFMPSSDGFSTYGGTVYERYNLQTNFYQGALRTNSFDDEWILKQNSEYVLGVYMSAAMTYFISMNIYCR